MNLWQVWDFIKDKSKKSSASRFLIFPSQRIISKCLIFVEGVVDDVLFQVGFSK
jgi:hypothetical protein